MRNFRLTLIALTLLGLSSCSKEHYVDKSEGRYPILFGSSETRATADLDDLKANGFKVHAYFEGNVGSSTFADGVSHNATDNVWDFDGETQYWIPSTTYNFKAFYPKVFTAGTLNVDNTSSALNYTITGVDINMQEDIMLAKTTKSVPDGASHPDDSSVVDLTFQHLLACVVIKVKSEISGVNINKVIINEASTNGTSSNGVWSSSNTTNINVTSGVALTHNADAVDVTNGGILVLPCMSDHETITIEASNKIYSELKLPDSTSWQAGNKYTYTATIKQENIVFGDPDVAIWDSDNATGSVIIR